VKRVNAGPLDVLQYTSGSSLLSKTSITPGGARGVREVMNMQRYSTQALKILLLFTPRVQ
jgi:hypothetical protein